MHGPGQLLALSLILLLPSIGLAQQATAEAILARYGRAIDPQGRLATIEGLSITTAFGIPNTEMVMKMTISQARGGLIHAAIEAPTATMSLGFDGTRAWMNQDGVVRDASEQELQNLSRGLPLEALNRAPEHFAKVALGEPTSVDGDPADCVRITTKAGPETVECFSRNSGLMVETRMTPPGATVEIVSRFSDYRPEAGILFPRRMVLGSGATMQQVAVTAITVGPIDPARFRKP